MIEGPRSQPGSHRDSLWKVLSVLAAAALLVGTSASVHYGLRLRAIYGGNPTSPAIIGPRQVSSEPIQFVELRSGRRDTVRLALTSGPALLLVYSANCAVCGDNMPRWLDLVAELRRGGSVDPVYAIDLDGSDTLGTYWPRVRGVRVLTPLEPETFLRQIPVTGTPATVVVHAGSLAVTIFGVIGAHRRSYVVSLLGERRG